MIWCIVKHWYSLWPELNHEHAGIKCWTKVTGTNTASISVCLPTHALQLITSRNSRSPCAFLAKFWTRLNALRKHQEVRARFHGQNLKKTKKHRTVNFNSLSSDNWFDYSKVLGRLLEKLNNLSKNISKYKAPQSVTASENVTICLCEHQSKT